MSTLPPKFAVFRGPRNSITGTESPNSAMIFTATPSDGSCYILSERPWMGYFESSRRPDMRVRSALICGVDGVAAPRKFIVLPQSVVCILPLGREEVIPMLAFQTTDWMPPAPPPPRILREYETENLRRIIRHLPYMVNLLMDDSTHSLCVRTMPDPLSILKDIVLDSMPLDVTPEVAYKVCDTIVRRRCEEMTTPLW